MVTYKTQKKVRQAKIWKFWLKIISILKTISEADDKKQENLGNFVFIIFPYARCTMYLGFQIDQQQ